MLEAVKNVGKTRSPADRHDTGASLQAEPVIGDIDEFFFPGGDQDGQDGIYGSSISQKQADEGQKDQKEINKLEMLQVFAELLNNGRIVVNAGRVLAHQPRKTHPQQH